MEMNRAGTLKVSKNTSAAFSRFLLGLSGASVRRTGCYKRQQSCGRVQTAREALKGSSRGTLLPCTRSECTSFSRTLSRHLRAVPLPQPTLSGNVCLAARPLCPPHSEEAAGPSRTQEIWEPGSEGAQQGGHSKGIRSLGEAWLPHLLGEGLQLVLGVDILPDALHVIPVPHHAVLHGVAQGQQPAVLLRRRVGRQCGSRPHTRHCLLPSPAPSRTTAASWVSPCAWLNCLAASQSLASLTWPGTGRVVTGFLPPAQALGLLPWHASLYSRPVHLLLSPHMATLPSAPVLSPLWSPVTPLPLLPVLTSPARTVLQCPSVPSCQAPLYLFPTDPSPESPYCAPSSWHPTLLPRCLICTCL